MIRYQCCQSWRCWGLGLPRFTRHFRAGSLSRITRAVRTTSAMSRRGDGWLMGRLWLVVQGINTGKLIPAYGESLHKTSGAPEPIPTTRAAVGFPLYHHHELHICTGEYRDLWPKTPSTASDQSANFGVMASVGTLVFTGRLELDH